MTRRCFEDVSIGGEMVTTVYGPVTTPHLMRWSAAIENWHKIHYDAGFAISHDKLPGLLINGSLKQQLIAQLLKDWAGPDGWLWKMNIQFRAMNMVAETLTVWAKVTGTDAAEQYGVIRLSVGICNNNGVESTPGTARVVLPYRNGLAVPVPFIASGLSAL